MQILFGGLQNTISELFSEPSGLESLVKEKEEEEKEKQERAAKPQKKPEQKKVDPSEQQALAQFEKVHGDFVCGDFYYVWLLL